MDNTLKEQYMKVLFRFKKAGLDFPGLTEVNMSELFVMAGIANNDFCCEKSVINTAEIQSHIFISKAAISLMFTSLEKRGYLIRETDKTNRRKITVELTPEGVRILAAAQKQMDELLEETLSRFGEEKTWQLISLLNQLSDISEELKAKAAAQKATSKKQ
jgi:DNA-binding MarR family transcriptional regulator